MGTDKPKDIEIEEVVVVGSGKGNKKIKQWKDISEQVTSKISKTELHQIFNDLEKLYTEAHIANKELIPKTVKFSEKTKGKAGFREGLKSKERAFEKINADYKGDASRLVDIAGSKVVYNTVDELYSALIKFSKESKILKIKDRIQEPLNGYRDVLMNIKMKNGHIVEFRLHLKEMDEIAESMGHKLYEQQRSLDAILLTRSLTKKEKDLYRDLVLSQNKLYEEVWQKIINN